MNKFTYQQGLSTENQRSGVVQRRNDGQELFSATSAIRVISRSCSAHACETGAIVRIVTAHSVFRSSSAHAYAP